MKFEEALKAMRKGKCVRRKAWGKAYIYIFCYADGKCDILTALGNPARLGTAILENDWEIVDERQIKIQTLGKRYRDVF